MLKFRSRCFNWITSKLGLSDILNSNKLFHVRISITRFNISDLLNFCSRRKVCNVILFNGQYRSFKISHLDNQRTSNPDRDATFLKHLIWMYICWYNVVFDIDLIDIILWLHWYGNRYKQSSQINIFRISEPTWIMKTKCFWSVVIDLDQTNQHDLCLSWYTHMHIHPPPPPPPSRPVPHILQYAMNLANVRPTDLVTKELGVSVDFRCLGINIHICLTYWNSRKMTNMLQMTFPMQFIQMEFEISNQSTLLLQVQLGVFHLFR